MLSFIINICVAVFLGTCIGLERQLRQRVAGLRTNALVALGAAIFMIIAREIGGDALGRIASYVISGIGFLGAGVIIKDGASIRGLNTAATLWCTAAIGAFCGLGYIWEPLIGTAIIICVHLFLRPLSNKIMKYTSFEEKETTECHYLITASCKSTVENHIRVLLIQYISNYKNLMLTSISSHDGETPSLAVIEVSIISTSKQDTSIEQIASYLTLEQDVSAIKWEINNIESHS